MGLLDHPSTPSSPSIPKLHLHIVNLTGLSPITHPGYTHEFGGYNATKQNGFADAEWSDLVSLPNTQDFEKSTGKEILTGTCIPVSQTVTQDPPLCRPVGQHLFKPPCVLITRWPRPGAYRALSFFLHHNRIDTITNLIDKGELDLALDIFHENQNATKQNGFADAEWSDLVSLPNTQDFEKSTGKEILILTGTCIPVSQTVTQDPPLCRPVGKHPFKPPCVLITRWPRPGAHSTGKGKNSLEISVDHSYGNEQTTVDGDVMPMGFEEYEVDDEIGEELPYMAIYRRFITSITGFLDCLPLLCHQMCIYCNADAPHFYAELSQKKIEACKPPLPPSNDAAPLPPHPHEHNHHYTNIHPPTTTESH
ncbi:hypothetical protein RJ639_034470 [Escallonia herrerae]|uniref:Uncharacterized protein n=1 Tax=Escallonia herrerae TaxID=1293975 RepID=A0AA88WZI6_9ASTE|nr:hypothetical protein RJ639_034470 [Escallonia herrerae]